MLFSGKKYLEVCEADNRQINGRIFAANGLLPCLAAFPPSGCVQKCGGRPFYLYFCLNYSSTCNKCRRESVSNVIGRYGDWSTVLYICIFSPVQKRTKGWWPFYAKDENDELLLQVMMINDELKYSFGDNQ